MIRTEVYQVWALGYDAEGQCTDYEEFLGEFTDKAEAIAHAEKYKDLSYIYDQDILDDMDDGEYSEVRVEVMKPIPEDELDGTEEEAWEVTDICWSNEIRKPGM